MKGVEVFHLAGALVFLWGCYYDYAHVSPPPDAFSSAKALGGKFKYLTFLDAMLQTLYFTIAFLNDFIGTNEYSPSRKPLIRKVKDTLFCCLAFPLAMFVGTTFWGIYAVDRELVFPKILDEFFPVWLNHLMHTNIVVFVLIELALTFRMYPTRKFGMSILSAVMLTYMIWVQFIYFKSGNWVYPILGVLNWPMRVVFYLFNLGMVLGLYVLGEKLNRVMWPKQVAQIVKSAKKKAH